MSNLVFWLTVGFLGQALFTARFLVQWVASERKRDSVVPVAFWWLSFLGGTALFSYAIFRRDPVIITGQGMGLFVYTRNLMLVSKARRRLQAVDGGREGHEAQGRQTSQQSLPRPHHGQRGSALRAGNLFRREAQEPLDGQSDVGSAHQGFTDQDGGDTRGFEPFYITAAVDTAFTHEHDLGRDLIAKAKGMLKIGAKMPEVAVVDSDQAGTRGQNAG